MPLVTLKPVIDLPSNWEALERLLIELFKTEVYLPLIKVIHPQKKVINSINDLLQSILSGHIRYRDNGFVGVFSAEVSKQLRSMGAVWSKRRLGWSIRESLLSGDILDAIRQAKSRDEALQRKVKGVLDSLDSEKIAGGFDATSLFEKVTSNTDRDFRKSVKELAMQPKLSPHTIEKLSSDYNENLRLYIRKFTDKQILELRKEVTDMTFKGERSRELAKKIEASYGVSKSKAKFLARQETNLLTSKLKEARYADVGVNEYRWQSVTGTSEHPVRPMHKALNDRSKRGETFEFSSPPVDDPKGTRHNPGENFGCRCVAVPVVRFK